MNGMEVEGYWLDFTKAAYSQSWGWTRHRLTAVVVTAGLNALTARVRHGRYTFRVHP